MKKVIVILFLAFCFILNSNAQQLVSKKGIPILPQQGDFAIGISATPFLNFAGNFTKINSAGAFSSTASWDFLDPSRMYIYGKYFLDDKTAIRGRLRIGQNTTTKNTFVGKDGSTTGEVVEDTWSHSTTNIILAAGLEKRRGYGRLQGFYGAEAMISLLGGSKDSYTYGNAITATKPIPTRSNLNGNNLGGSYITSSTNSMLFGIGVNAFVGVEYFFAPKISIGGEFGWGIGINQAAGVTGNGQQTTETWSSGAVNSKTTDVGGKVSSFNIDTKSSSAQLFFMFHF